MSFAFFTAEPDGGLLPTDVAISSWGADHVHGVAVSGALARCAEQAAAGQPELTPAKHSVDLFRPVRRRACDLTASVVRESGRITLVDVELRQDDEPVARSSTLFVRPSETPAGDTWTPGDRVGPPPAEIAPPTDQPHVPMLRSDEDWSQDFGQHQNAGRKTSWNCAVPIVAGESLTPFQAAAAIADGASLVTNWGSHGVEHINTDLTLVLARLPRGVEVGLHAVDRVEVDGVMVGTAAVFDRDGTIGSVVLTGLANTARTIDLAEVARS